MTPLDLLLFTGAVYGASWTLTKSRLCARPRKWFEGWPFIGPLSQCVVCTSAWVAFALCWALPHTTIFSPALRPETPADFVVLVAWSVAASWILGHLLGDAD